jgi:hypothetical protein
MIDRAFTRFQRSRRIKGCTCDYCRNNLNEGQRYPCAYCKQLDCPAAQEHWQTCRNEFTKKGK